MDGIPLGHDRITKPNDKGRWWVFECVSESVRPTENDGKRMDGRMATKYSTMLIWFNLQSAFMLEHNEWMHKF